MRCIICLNPEPPSGFSKEHVFPEAVGGTLVIELVCKSCNDLLGRSVDAPLTSHLLVELARMRLDLKGKKGHVPNPLERATLRGEPDQKVRFAIDPTKPRPQKLYTLPNIKKVDLGDGHTQVHVHIDVDDADSLEDIINKTLTRAGYPSLPSEEIGRLMCRTRNDEPVLEVPLTLDTSQYRRGLMKIAYELAFLWLGESYLDDSTAKVLRACMLDTSMPSVISSKYHIRGSMPLLSKEHLLPFWKDEPDSLIAAGLRQKDMIGIYLRILGALDCMIGVTEHVEKYPAFEPQFISIDVKTGRTRTSTFEVESARIATSDPWRYTV